MSSDTWHNDPWSHDRADAPTHGASHNEALQSDHWPVDTAFEPQAFDPHAYYAAPPHTMVEPSGGPQPYTPPATPVAQPPAPNRSLLTPTDDEEPDKTRLSLIRKTGIILFAFIGLYGLFASLRGLSPLETGLTYLLAAGVGTFVLNGMAMRQLLVRATLCVAVAGCAAMAATSLLPHLGLWPADSTNLLVAMTFATVGTLAHSRLCLGIALIVLVNLLFQGNGLGLMPGRTQIAVLALFGIGLLGGVTAGSRFIASISLLSLFVAHIHIMASAALPSGSALGVTLITALCAAALMRSTYQRGLKSALEPMFVAIGVFAVATLTFQLVLLGGNGGPDMLETAPMRGSVVTVLLGTQMIVLISGLYDWFENRASLQSVLSVQAVLAMLTLMLLDPRRMVLLPGIDASGEMAFLTGIILAAIIIRILFHAWRTDKPIVTGVCALILMAEAIMLLRFVMTGLDVAFAALVCAVVAIVMGGVMAVNARKTSQVARS
ncbi:hypothetical protein ACFFUB_12125 [Algimonas porphyrae]|uniref:DUF2339 domain-containing protein n=1 Tax=Algimonas porphyrae TaxID=1128113 RepID=A0ABQ5UV53_9PROT|nr:hypothetical protein [Algimonas porphyrae]GLQ19155.1 hypothetical protein GCM10007854_01100 [Algimonas porphyrae]